MNKIVLPNGIWYFDPATPLGAPGGFGAVFWGYSDKIGEVAVKQITEDAHRELYIAGELLNKQYEYVIPVYDAGQDIETGVNYLVMARAERSLQDEIRTTKSISEQEAISVLLQIVNGLLEVPSLVHRDLKPGNILLHSGIWKVADFGIAKFVEETTSSQTLRDFLSAPYAAPEQWNLERPTNAIDVYALGCIAFALLTGSPPFTGSREDLKDQHLHKQPPIGKIANTRLQTLVGMMLRKSPETRPSLERIRTILEQINNQISSNIPSDNFGSLALAAAKVSEKSALAEAQKLSEKSAQEHRNIISQNAQEIMFQIVDHLFRIIQNTAPNAVIDASLEMLYGYKVQKSKYKFFPNRSIKLGEAELAFDFNRFPLVPENAFVQSGWDVIAGVIVKITQNSREPYIRSANLWFTNLGKGQEYRWWEVSYMVNPLMRSHPKYEPYAVENLSEADIAAAPILAQVQFGSKPKLVDDEYADEFCARWANLFAQAVNGELSFPRSLPLD